MARYYFDIRTGRGCHPDDFGDEFGSFEEAGAQVRSILSDIAREEMPRGDVHTVTCDMRDDTGRIVYRGTLTFEGWPL